MEKGPTTREYKGVNIGDVQSPKMINIGKCFSLEEREASKQCFIEYQDVFAWSYEDLKSYRGGK